MARGQENGTTILLGLKDYVLFTSASVLYSHTYISSCFAVLKKFPLQRCQGISLPRYTGLKSMTFKFIYIFMGSTVYSMVSIMDYT